ncbi:hypothetical protein ABIE67_009476 [Streptomyces sp. V4I8]
MAPLQPRPRQTVRTDHAGPQARHSLLLAPLPQVQVILEQLPQQVTAPVFQEILQLMMGQIASRRRCQEAYSRGHQPFL